MSWEASLKDDMCVSKDLKGTSGQSRCRELSGPQRAEAGAFWTVRGIAKRLVWLKPVSRARTVVEGRTMKGRGQEGGISGLTGP